MLTDTTGIQHLAHRMRERAEEIRAESRRLRRRADEVPWQGCAAEAMRAQVEVRLATLAATASLHDDAADALGRHARAVDLVGAAIDTVGGVVGDAVEDTAHALRSLW